MKICCDPGHGGQDPGAMNLGLDLKTPVDDLYEKHFTLWAAESLEDELVARGHEVKLTRTVDSTLANRERVRIANSFNAQALLCIHCNAAVNSKATGFEVLYDDAKPQDLKLAECLAESFRRNFRDRKYRGIITDAQCPREHLSVLEGARMPACLVELGFISNQEEAYWLLEHLGEIAKALADGLEKWGKSLC